MYIERERESINKINERNDLCANTSHRGATFKRASRRIVCYALLSISGLLLHANGAWVYLEKTVNLDDERIKPKQGKKGMTRRTIWSVVDGDIQDPQLILINVSLLYALG